LGHAIAAKPLAKQRLWRRQRMGRNRRRGKRKKNHHNLNLLWSFSTIFFPKNHVGSLLKMQILGFFYFTPILENHNL
jgi:hypothetical protein